MTGYALATRETPAGQVSVELRSVNSRFLDLILRMPDELRIAEPSLRELIGGAVQRGKLECRVALRAGAGALPQAQLEPDVVDHLAALQAQVRTALPDSAPLSVGEVLRWPGVLAEQASAESLVPTIVDAAREAIADFVATRAREGARLAALILERAEAIDARTGGFILHAAEGGRIGGAFRTRVRRAIVCTPMSGPLATIVERLCAWKDVTRMAVFQDDFLAAQK